MVYSLFFLINSVKCICGEPFVEVHAVNKFVNNITLFSSCTNYNSMILDYY